MPSRLRDRIGLLEDVPSPHMRLRAWMSGRGRLFRAWAFRPVIDDLSVDDRLILGGEHGAQNLAPSDHLHAYVAAEDLDPVANDHNLRAASGERLPNVLLWAVADPDAVPRRRDVLARIPHRGAGRKGDDIQREHPERREPGGAI